MEVSDDRTACLYFRYRAGRHVNGQDWGQKGDKFFPHLDDQLLKRQSPATHWVTGESRNDWS